MISKGNIKILLLSPLGKNLNGGIAQWTKHILHYYNAHNNNIQLEILYNENIQTTSKNESKISRIIKGIKNYLPLYNSFLRKTKS